MKWYNTRLDKLPKDKQEVLVSSEGVNYIAVYDANTRMFNTSELSKKKNFRADELQLYWTEYSRPGKK